LRVTSRGLGDVYKRQGHQGLKGPRPGNTLNLEPINTGW
jgi:hypothetical protein